MLDTDLLPIPSFRPDGRLERLNSGGGSNKQKVDRWVGSMKEYKKETGQNPFHGGAAGYGKFDKWQSEQSATAVPQQQQATAPVAQAAAATPPASGTKKRRTLLSGQQSLSQPYGNSTILGA